MYIYGDGAIQGEHPIRRSVYTAFPWLLIHLPMSAGLLIGGHVSAASTIDEFTRKSLLYHIEIDMRGSH